MTAAFYLHQRPDLYVTSGGMERREIMTTSQVTSRSVRRKRLEVEILYLSSCSQPKGKEGSEWEGMRLTDVGSLP